MVRLAAVVLLIAAAVQPERPPAFATRAEGVRLDVSVVRRGRPVRGLGANDFRVFDNGVPQRVEHVFTEEEPVDAWLLFDQSESSAGDVWPKLQAAAHAFVDALGPRDRVGVVSFGSGVHRAAGPETSRAQAREAIRALTPSGSTRLFDAVFAASLAGSSSGRRTILVAFTDGRDNASIVTRHELDSALARTGMVLYVVFVGRTAQKHVQATDPDRWRIAARLPAIGLLRDLTGLTGGEVFTANSPGDLRDAYSRVLQHMKSRYVIVYVPSGVPSRGWHDLRVTSVKGADVRTRQQYWSEG
jgi:VWFA-related protein